MPGIGIGLGMTLGGGGGAGVPVAKAARVAGGAVGTVYAVTRLLGGGSTLALVAGTHANLTLAGTGIRVAAGLGGASQTAVVREGAGMIAVEYPVVLTGDGVPAATPAMPLRAMAAGAAVPTGTATADSGVTLIRNRTRAPILANSPVIQPRFPLFATSDAGGGIEAPVVWPAGTIFRASVEITVSTGGTPTTTLRRLTFGGGDTYVAPAGGTTEPVLVPDELPASGFGLARFAKGDVVYIKQEILFPTSGTGVMPIADGSGASAANSGEGCYYGGTGSVDLTGNLAAQGGTTRSTRIMKPLVILGRHAGVAVWGGGDSITFGKGIVAHADGMTAGSWPVLAAYNAGLPLTKVAISGDRVAACTPARRAVALSLAAFHTHAVLAYGTNDVGAGGANASLGGLIAALADALRAVNPAIACWGSKVPLRVSTSSDGYRTLAGQTQLNPGWGAGGAQEAGNAAVAALVGRTLAGVLDINAGFADPADPYRWKSDGTTANLSTGDGTHPTQVRQTDAAGIAQGVMAGWSV